MELTLTFAVVVVTSREMIDEAYGVFNETQWRALIWVSRCTGTLSLVGSGALIYVIILDFSNKISRPRNRFLFIMSWFDVLSSIAWVISTAASPQGTAYGAKGNEATCTVHGLLVTVGLCVPIYNGMLCAYYLATIRYHMNEEVFKKKYEPWMHLMAILPSLVCCVLGAVFHMFVPVPTVCFFSAECKLNAQSPECEESPFDSFIDGVRTAVLVIGAVNFLVISISMIGVFLAVRKPRKRMQRYSFRQSQVDDEPNNTTDQDREEEKETVIQAFLFVAVYLLTYSPAVINTFPGTGLIFELYLLQSILTPLQGFWNFFIFLRPRFNIIRKRNKEKGILWAFVTAIITAQFVYTTNDVQGTTQPDDQNINPVRRQSFTVLVTSSEPQAV